MDTEDAQLTRTKISLQDGWQAKLNQDGRLYYIDHNTKTSHWLPPPTSWSDEADLPYGWEAAVDKNGKPYYINHVTGATTREDPFEIEDIPPVEREVLLTRDSELGFGFIAGSEKPVVIRSVTEGGPSVGKLLPGDKILKINNEDVYMKEGQFIIERIRQSHELIRLTVIQPHLIKTGLKSSFLSTIKKQKLKAKPSRVRFADNESIATIQPQSTRVPPSLVYLPNVLKVYLENGQTKSFKYDNKTTVKDVLHNLQEKLGIKCMEYFSLVVQDIRNPTHQQLTILQDDELVRQTAARPGSQHLKCLLRVTFVPKDAYDLLSRDPTAFDYFYRQCCNDVVNGRFADELKFETAVKLAALQIQQHVLCNKQKAKVSIKAIQKDDGLERFLPKSIIQKYKSKELRKVIGQHIKQNQNLTAPGQKHLTELQAKLHYLKVIGELKSFGGKFYSGTLLYDTEETRQGTDMTVLVGPKCSISWVTDTRTNSLSTLVNFSELNRLRLSRKGPICDDIYRLQMCRNEHKPLVFLLHTEDAQDMACLINGYYRLFEDPNHSLLPDDETKSFLMNTEAPPYTGKHHVIAAGWNYPEDLVSEIVAVGKQDSGTPRGHSLMRRMEDGEHIVDLTSGPPPYVYDAAFISKLKQEKRFRSRDSIDEIDGAHSCESESESECESQVTRNVNDSFLDSSGNDSSPGKGSMMDLSSLTDLVDSMFGMTTERQDDDDSKRTSLLKNSTEKKKFSFSEAVRPKRQHSLSSMKYNVSDAVASSDDESCRGVKLVHFSSFRDDLLRNDRKDNSDSEGGDFVDSVPKRKKAVSNSKAALKSRDSLYLIRTKVNYSGRNSPNPETFSSDDDDIVHNISNSILHNEEEDRDISQDPSVKGVESDIIDLTMHDASVADIDISIDSDLSGIHIGLDVDNQDDVILTTNTDLVVADNDDDVTPTQSSKDLESVEITQEALKKAGEEEDLPVSVIDMPSPDTDEEDQELSDQAHGIQMAAIDALNASIQDEAINLGARPEPDCESDSGNETISSETIDNPIDQIGFSHSPTDYFHIAGDDKQPGLPKSSSPEDDGDTIGTSSPDSSTLTECLPDNSELGGNLTPNNSGQNDSIFDGAIQEGKDTFCAHDVPDSDQQAQSNFVLNESINGSNANESIHDDLLPLETSYIDSVQEISVRSAVMEDVTVDESRVESGDESKDVYAIQDKSIPSSLVSDEEMEVSIIKDSTQETSILDDSIADDDNHTLAHSDYVISTSDDLSEPLYQEECLSRTDEENDNTEEAPSSAEIKEDSEDQRQTPTNQLSMTHGSDTDSCASTLRGSSSNLTSLESAEEEFNEISVGEYSSDNTLEDKEETDTDTIDDLIASLIVAPPPLVPDVDEELLGIIIPPPPVDDFDFGTIDDVVVATPRLDEEEQTEKETFPPGDGFLELREKLTSCSTTAELHQESEVDDPVSNDRLNSQSFPVEEQDLVVEANRDAVMKAESPLTKYINSLKVVATQNTSPADEPHKLDVQHSASGPSPRKFRRSAGSVGESLDSGFHQSDSCDLDSLSSCFSSLQEGQFMKEKTVTGLDTDRATLHIQKEPTENTMGVKSSTSEASVAISRISEDDQVTATLKTREVLDDTVSTIDTQQCIPSVKISKSDTNEISGVENEDCVNTLPVEDNKQSTDAINVDTKSVDTGSGNAECEAIQALEALTLSLDDNVSIASTLSSEDGYSSRDIASHENHLRCKSTKPKPAVPPKPIIHPNILRKIKSLDSGLAVGKNDSNQKRKMSAPDPPPRKRYNSPLPAKKMPQSGTSDVSVQRSESMQVFSSDYTDSKASADTTGPKTVMHSSSISSRHPLVRSHAIETSQSSSEDLQSCTDDTEVAPIEKEKERNPVKRSNTISVTSPEREPGRLYPARKAPPPPMPKPKSKVGVSGTWAARSSKPGSINPPSIRKLLSPGRSKPWVRGPLPFARNTDPTPEPVPKSPTKEKRKSSTLPHKIFHTWTRKESSKAKHSLGQGDSKRGKVDPPSLRVVSGLKRPSVLDLAERIQQAGDASATSSDSRTVNRTISLRSPRQLPKTSVVYSPRQSNNNTYAPVTRRSYSEENDSHPDKSPRERPKSMPCSPVYNQMEVPKRPPPPRPRAPPRTNSFDGSLSSESSGTMTPPRPRAVSSSVPCSPRTASPGSSPRTLSPEEPPQCALSPVPLPSPVPPEDLDSSISSDITSPPPLPSSAPPPLPSSTPPVSSSIPSDHSTTPPSARSLHPIAKETFNSRYYQTATLEIESKDYSGPDCIANAIADIEIILSELHESVQNIRPTTPTIAQFRKCKQVVICEAREFTSNTKMLVSSAGQSAQQLEICLNSSMHTLARLCSGTQHFIRAMPSINQARNLGNKIQEIASNFCITIQVAVEAHGKPLHHHKMQVLLRQAQTMALMLSALMRTLRVLHC